MATPVRQRVARIIDDLAVDPRPSSSRALRLPSLTGGVEWEIRRIRLDDWRIVCGVDDAQEQAAVLGIRRRPPYDYSDLEELLTDLWS